MKPLTLRIGRRTWRVVTVPGLRAQGMAGQMLWDERRIELDASLPPRATLDALLHEVTHACWPTPGEAKALRPHARARYPEADVEEEVVAWTLAKRLCALLCDGKFRRAVNTLARGARRT